MSITLFATFYTFYCISFIHILDGNILDC